MSVTGVNERLAALTAAGTSVWLDQIRRGMIEDGELARMVEEDSLRGVTSNPAIFEKAILGSPDYDEDLAAGAREGLSAREVYRRLAVRDVQLAADVLRPVYDETSGYDGYVSLEVAPRLAHDTEGTLEQARMYWGLVDRPNLMIKIPATDEGIPAIEQALYEGMNVNITLLFAVSYYERVMEAFLSAMERRHAEGKPLDRHSVASFFVSRVDTEVDKRLEALGRSDLAGRAGLANARAAYLAFQRVFEGDRFAQLRDAGAPVQRPLWASTGVKNPAYPETMYVYGLVGPDTVNTMPLPTLTAAAREGDVTGATAADDPTRRPRRAARGRDRPRRRHRQAAARRHRRVRGPDEQAARRDRVQARGDRHRPARRDRGRPAGRARAGGRGHDQACAARRTSSTASGTATARCGRRPGTPELTDRLGWLDISEKMLDQVDDLIAFADDVRRSGITDAVLLGMGGSSLAPEVFRRSWADQKLRAARARLDAPGPDPGDGRRARPRQDALHRLVEVRRHDRDDVAVQVLPRAPAGRRALRGGHRPRHVAGQARRRARLPARVRERPGDRRALLGAVVLRPRAGRADGRRHPARCSRRPQVAVQQLPAQGGQLRACGSASRSASWPARARQADVRRRRAARARSASGSSSSSPSRPASTAAASCRSPTSRSSTPAPTGRTACSCTSPPATRSRPRRSRRCAAAGHPTITVNAEGPADLGRIFFYSEFATAVAGWVLEHQPVRPAQRAGGQGQHRARAQGGLAATSTRATLDDIVGGARAAGLRRDPRVPAVQRRDRRGGRALPREAHHRARRRDDVRLRPALPALDRPVPQGRPVGRARSSSSSTSRRPTSRCPARRTRSRS